jgi:signal transduction histidine kinase
MVASAPPRTAPVPSAPTVPPGPGRTGHAGPTRFSLRHVPALPATVRESRHRLLIAVLALHLLAVLCARFLTPTWARSHAVVLGLAWSSYAVTHLAGGGESHLQPLFVLALVALYQDLELLLVMLTAEIALLAVPAALNPDLVFTPGTAHPWTVVLEHGVALFGVAVATSLAWRRDVPVPVFAPPPTAPPQRPPTPDPEVEQSRERARQAELTLARRQTSYALMTNLARRNQSLIGRQLATLDELERDERDPDVLAGLFALDHLATRMRRNAENLLVLAGAPASSRGFAQPVPVAELLRGAAAEVEQYARVDVSVSAGSAVAGHVVSDVAHLLAELLDNALACSPPDSRVNVGSAPYGDGGLRLWVADEGIGMTTTRLAEHNEMLRSDDDEEQVGATLGFPVVRRLAGRHNLQVTLGAREGGGSGLIAYVDLPATVVVRETAAAVEGPTGGAPSVLPGRRAPRRAPAADARMRRNELALDAKHEAVGDPLFAPTPLPEDEGTADGGDLWASADVLEEAVAIPLDDPLFAPLPSTGARPVEADDSALTAALHAWAAAEPTPARVDTANTVVPSGAPGATLVHRIPQQALREAGGAPLVTAMQTFEPGPAIVAEPVGGPDPGRASALLQTYRAGLNRARIEPATGDPGETA